jgi:hypothetical protein
VSDTGHCLLLLFTEIFALCCEDSVNKQSVMGPGRLFLKLKTVAHAVAIVLANNIAL